MNALSRQRRYQLRKQASGICVCCNKQAETGKTRCPECRDKNREYNKLYRIN